MSQNEQDQTVYKVVINHEEQYSIWPSDRENPLGWCDVGKRGPKQECLDFIEQVWTDMRPLSLRKHMDAAAGSQTGGPPEPGQLSTAMESDISQTNAAPKRNERRHRRTKRQ